MQLVLDPRARTHELVAASDDTVVALTTGCLCCKVRSDLTATLHDLLARRDAGSLPQRFDHIVIETSGLADPAPILHALLAELLYMVWGSIWAQNQ